MAKELIWIILRENNVELSQDTLNFYLKKVLEDHKDLHNPWKPCYLLDGNSNYATEDIIMNYRELELNDLKECLSIDVFLTSYDIL